MESLDRRSLGLRRSGSDIEEKPEGMTDRQWMSLEKKTCSVIRRYVADATFYSVL